MGKSKGKENKSFNYVLAGFEESFKKTDIGKRPAKKGKSVDWVSKRFAFLRRKGDPELRKDLSRTEFRPEQKENAAEAIKSGRRFSSLEQDRWNTTVRYKIREIVENRGMMISPDSKEEQEVFAAVARFMEFLPHERSKLLRKMNTPARIVMRDLNQHREGSQG